MDRTDCVMIATIGGQPQVVTFALDELLRQGQVIRRVIVLHLTPQIEDNRTAAALDRLEREFVGTFYGDHPCRLEFLPIRRGAERLDDIRDEVAANVAWDTIYQLIAGLKAQGYQLHVCISGGRRMLALLATSAAMLHFDHNDRLWHMYTPPEFMERARDGAILHARPEDGVRLIQVPVAPWGAYFPALRTLTGASPREQMAAQMRWMDAAEQERCRRVAERLTPRQLDVLRAFACGQNPQAAAESLTVTVKTVHAHKTVILAECRNAWEMPEDAQLGYHFLLQKFGPYFQQERTIEGRSRLPADPG